MLRVCGALSAKENEKAKVLLDRIVAMLTKLGGRGYSVQEELGQYRTDGINPESEAEKTGKKQIFDKTDSFDPDSDPDSDPDQKSRKTEPFGQPGVIQTITASPR